MAKCDLSIELDDSDRVYVGGQWIKGVIRVRADTDVTCKGLEVKSVWRTHGRGNVAKGEADSAIVFEGPWQSGDEAEYPFKLRVADWPPTYHGFNLNIEHSIDVRAKLPWAFDAKASQPFVMTPVRVDQNVTGGKAIELTGAAAMTAMVIFLIAFIGVSGMIVWNVGPIALAFIAIPVALMAGYGLYRWLPKWVLGDVTCELAKPYSQPGETIRGELVLRPGKRVKINGITVSLEGTEKCVSGSGSNRTTHTHKVHRQTMELAEPTTLAMGQEQRFAIECQVPGDAPYSVNLSDNDIHWDATVRVALPSWPDWTKTFRVEVRPSGNVADETSLPSDRAISEPYSDSLDGGDGDGGDGDGGITLAETVAHLWGVREDREMTDQLVEAVTGLTFDVEAIIERRLLYAGDEDPHVYAGGFAVWARYPDPELPMVLYVPSRSGDDFEQAGRGRWRGRGTIVGWDHRHGRLQIKV